MNDKKVLEHFMEQLEFHSIKYAGQSEKKDWYLVEITDEMMAIIDDEGDIVAYTNHGYHSELLYKYTEDYILAKGKLYYNEYTGSKLETLYGYNIEKCIEDIIFYDEAELLELILDHQSVFMHEGQLIGAGAICYFTIPKKSVLKVYWRNEILRLETVRGEVYYMARSKKRMYSSKSWRGKKLQKRFF